jgi:hypothetical protein
MKLIIQVDKDGSKFAYFESEAHHKRVEKQRGGERLDPKLLDNECDLSAYRGYFVIDVKPPRKKHR